MAHHKVIFFERHWRPIPHGELNDRYIGGVETRDGAVSVNPREARDGVDGKPNLMPQEKWNSYSKKDRSDEKQRAPSESYGARCVRTNANELHDFTPEGIAGLGAELRSTATILSRASCCKQALSQVTLNREYHTAPTERTDAVLTWRLRCGNSTGTLRHVANQYFTNAS